MKDAAGNTPAKLTSFEKEWHSSIEDGTLQKNYDKLVRRQVLPLEEKISISMERIREWYQAFDGKVAVSFSGGKDSSVLLWMVRQAYPEVPAVFCNTGLEYPEIYSIMKKDPMHRYEKETGRAQFVGMMASDSKRRERVYLQTGCNAFDNKSPRSMPMGFWTNQDVIEAIQAYNIPYAGVYGEINKSLETGQLYFSGVHSTGCIFCAFGLHMEQAPNRFQQLAVTHPKQYEFCMEKLGLRKVLDYIHDNCPDLKAAGKFACRKYKPQMQGDLFPEMETA